MYKVPLEKYISLNRFSPYCLIAAQIRPKQLSVLQRFASISPASNGSFQANNIPGPRQLPYIGTFFTHVFGKGLNKIHEQTHDWYHKYGDIFQYKLLGKEFIAVCDLATAEKLYRTEVGGKWPYRNFDQWISALLEINREENIPPSLLDLNGEKWAKLRAVLGKRLLRPLELKNYYDGFNDTALDVIKLIMRTKDEAGTIQDLKDILQKWAMESIGIFAFGERTGLLESPPDPVAIKVYDASDGLLLKIQKVSIHKWAKYLFRSEYKTIKQDLQIARINIATFANKVILELENAAKEGRPVKKGIDKSFVAYLAGQDGMSLEECAAHAGEVYQGGLATTSVVTSWLLYALALNPDAQELLFKEILEKIPEDGMLTYEAAQGMPYLRACMKESLRLYNPIYVMLRYPEEDIEANGYIIPAKSNVLIQHRIMSLSEKYVSEPLKFIPERWMRDKNEGSAPNSFMSLPFGYGPRSCVGRRIAEAEIQVFVTQLIKRFRIKYKGKPQTGVVDLHFAQEHPLAIEFSER